MVALPQGWAKGFMEKRVVNGRLIHTDSSFKGQPVEQLPKLPNCCRYILCSRPARGKIHDILFLFFGYCVGETMLLKWCIGQGCQCAIEVAIIS